MVVEKTDDGLHLLDNPLGVLSNSPEFSWHMTNLRGYMNVAPSQSEKAEWGPAALSPFGQGAGTFGLPGDYTPPSRFVRTAYLKTHTEIPSDRDGAVAACFHIMDSVTIPKGPVITSRETADYTQYTAFMNITQGEYYFKTYDNSGISAARLPVGRSLGTRLISLGKLNKPPVFEWIND